MTDHRLTAAPSVARMSTGVRASLVDKVKEMTQKHRVVVFAKTYCPYCQAVKELFRDLQVETQVYDLDELGAPAILTLVERCPVCCYPMTVSCPDSWMKEHGSLKMPCDVVSRPMDR